MDKKNLYLIIIISIFFAIDAIMHNYVFTSNEIIQTNTNIINNENKGLDNLTEDDLKLNEDKHISDKKNNTEEIKQNYENQNSEIIKISVKHCSSKSKNFESFKKDLQGNIANLEINSTIYYTGEQTSSSDAFTWMINDNKITLSSNKESDDIYLINFEGNMYLNVEGDLHLNKVSDDYSKYY